MDIKQIQDELKKKEAEVEKLKKEEAAAKAADGKFICNIVCLFKFLIYQPSAFFALRSWIYIPEKKAVDEREKKAEADAKALAEKEKKAEAASKLAMKYSHSSLFLLNGLLWFNPLIFFVIFFLNKRGRSS